MYQFERESYERRMAWFREARFGLFLHWGLYAIPARGEWVRSTERMPESEYLPFVDEFTAADFDPKAWAKAAKEAGFVNIKGHRSVGGMRASIYNAMPTEGVRALVEFMKRFEEENC